MTKKIVDTNEIGKNITSSEGNSGFVILGDMDEWRATPSPPEPPRPERILSDAIRAANSRTEYHTHIIEPVFLGGETTGEWRVYILRGKRFHEWMHPKKVPWDRNFDSREEAEDWARAAVEYIRNGK